MADAMTEFDPESANPFRDVPIEVTVSVGKARPKISDLLALHPNKTLVLDRRVDDPVDLFVNGRLIARGNLEEAGDSEGAEKKLVVRVTEIVSGHTG